MYLNKHIMKIIKTYKKAILIGFILPIIYIAIIEFLPYSDYMNRIESYLQFILLTIAVITYPKFEGKEAKHMFLKGLLIIITFSVLTNNHLWVMNPSSEVQPVIVFLKFIFLNNYISLFGISILLLKFGIKELTKWINNNKDNDITNR